MNVYSIYCYDTFFNNNGMYITQSFAVKLQLKFFAIRLISVKINNERKAIIK